MLRERLQIFKRLLNLVAPFIKNLYKITFWKIFLLMISLSTPMIYKILIDDVIIGRNTNKINFVIYLYIILYALETCGAYMNKKVCNSFSYPFMIKIKTLIIDKCLKSNSEFADTNKPGDLVELLDRDVEEVNNFVLKDLLDFGFNCITFLVCAIFLAATNYIMALICLISLPLTYLITKKIGNYVWKVSKTFREQFAQYKSTMQKNVSNWKEIKMYSLYDDSVELLNQNWVNLSETYKKKQLAGYFNRALINFKDLFITKINLYFIGGLLVLNGSLDIAILFVFMNYYTKFYNAVEQVSNSTIEFKDRKVKIEKVLNIVESKNVECIASEVKDFKELIIKDLSFAYPNFEKLVLKNLNFKVEKGDRVGIIGESGCGKSTLIKLLLKYYKVPENAICLYDENGNKDDNIVSYVNVLPQNTLLFNLSIRENFELMKKGISIEEIKFLCDKTKIKNKIESLEDGYETIIGENGNIFSGGQKQRIAFARMMSIYKPIIILDEFSNEIDVQDETIMIDSLEEYIKDKTLIAISHSGEINRLYNKVLYINK